MENKASDSYASKNIVSDEEILDISEMISECAEEFDEIFIADSNEVSATPELLKSVNNRDVLVSLNDCRNIPIFNRGNITLNTNTSKTIGTLSEAELIALVEAITECAAEFSQNFNATSPDLMITSQREEGEKCQSKRKRENDENSEESDQLNNSKKKLIESDEEDVTEEDEDLRCSICTELFIRAVTLNCSHTFCKYCIDRWRTNSPHCPICRRRMDSAYPTLIIDNLIEKKIGKCTDEVKELRDQIVEERSTPAVAPTIAPAPTVAPAVAPAVNVDNGPIIVIDSQESDEVESNEDTEVDENSEVDEDMEEYENSEVDEDMEEYENSEVDEDMEEYEYTAEDYEELYSLGLYSNYYYVHGSYFDPFHLGRHPYYDPINYYGGYGRCYVCNQQGHWAPRCPLKLHRS